MYEQQDERPEAPSVFRRFVLACRARPAVTLLLMGALTAICYLGAQRLWPSDSYRVKRTISGVVDGLKAGDVPEVLSYVSPYFSEEGVDTRMLRHMLRHVLGRRELVRASVNFQQIQVTYRRAVVKIHVRSVHRGDYGMGMATSEWIVGLELVQNRWLVRTARPVTLNGRRVAGLRALLVASF